MYYKEEAKKKLRGCINLRIATCRVSVKKQKKYDEYVEYVSSNFLINIFDDSLGHLR